MILTVFFLFLSFVLLAYAARCSAIQDVVKHKFEKSVFYQPGTIKKKFGFEWNWWYKSAGSNKYITDDDGNRIRRTTKILGIKIHLVQFYDAWHFYKMLKIGAHILADITAGVAAVFIFTTPISVLVTWWALLVFGYFFLQAVNWNIFFNNHYDNWLLK